MVRHGGPLAMRFVRVVNTTRGTILGARIRIADDFRSRTFGLLGSPPPAPGGGLLLIPCRGIHMVGMHYPLDVLFLDSKGAVVGAHHALRPGPRFRWSRHAASALELPTGTLRASGTRRGDVVVWSPADSVSSAAAAPAAEADAPSPRRPHRDEAAAPLGPMAR